MENQKADMDRSGVLGVIAGALNAGGGAMVYAYDMTNRAAGKLYSVVKKAPVFPGKAYDVIVSSIGISKPSEIKSLEEKIRVYEKKIKELYFEIGKEGAKVSDPESPLEADPVKKLISEVREYEKEIQRIEYRIAEIKEEREKAALRKAEKKVAAEPAEEKAKITDEQVLKAVGAAMEKAVRQGIFENSSERAIFEKVAADLLDNEMEIKALAAAELGKIGNPAAVPILMEAVGFGDSDLTSEIINSLINLGAREAIPLFKEKVNDSEFRIRIACLRGLFKLADDEDVSPILIEALRDNHPEVRRNAATFIGWRDFSDAVPALVQCLRDEEVRVRKAAVAALANIKDESSVLPLLKLLRDKDLEVREKAVEAIQVISGDDIAFDVHASGSALKRAIDDLRDWWQEKKLSDLEVAEPAAPDAELEATAIAEAAGEISEPEEAAEEIFESEAAVAEDVAEPDPAPDMEPEYTEEKLMRMLKSELLDLCRALGIECDEALTKAQITELILMEKK